MIDLKARLDALAASPRLRTQMIGHELTGGGRLPLAALTYGDPELPSIVVAAGIHGDEPEGTEAALRLLEQIVQGEEPLARFRLIVLPCVNPSGLALGTRANALGQDLNRQFHADNTPANAAVRHFLQPQRMIALADLHTDRSAQGFYLFELLHQAVSLASGLLSAVTASGETLEPAPFYAGLVGSQGLMAPTEAQLAGFIRAAPGASLAQWGWQSGVPRSYVFETPGTTDGKRGVAMHLAALEALFQALEDEAKAA